MSDFTMQAVSLLAYPYDAATSPVITAPGNVLPTKDYITKTLLGLTEYDPNNADGYAPGAFVLCDGKVWKNTGSTTLKTRPGVGVAGWASTTVLNAINAAATNVNVDGSNSIDVSGTVISVIPGHGIKIDANGVSSTIPTYNATTGVYRNGNVVSHENVIYRCNIGTGQTTSGPFNPSNWDALTADTAPLAGYTTSTVDGQTVYTPVAGKVKVAKTGSGLTLDEYGGLSVNGAEVATLDANGQIALSSLPNLQVNNIWTADGIGDTGNGMCSSTNTSYDPSAGLIPHQGDICIVSITDPIDGTVVTTPYILMTNETSGSGNGLKQAYQTSSNWRAITTADDAITTVSDKNSVAKIGAIKFANATWGTSAAAKTLTIDSADTGTAGITYLAKAASVLSSGSSPTPTTNWTTSQGYDDRAATPRAVVKYVNWVVDAHEGDDELHLPSTANVSDGQVLTVSVNDSTKTIGWQTITIPTVNTAAISSSGSGSSITWTETEGTAKFAHENFSIDDGRVTINAATTNTLGGVMVKSQSGLKVDNTTNIGAISVDYDPAAMSIQTATAGGRLTVNLSFYNESTTYSVGAVVVSGNTLYQSIAGNNTGNTPSSSGSKWRNIGEVFRYVGPYLSSTYYMVGDIVSVPSGLVYRSTATVPHTNSPADDPTGWTSFIGAATDGIYGLVRYDNDTIVKENGKLKVNSEALTTAVNNIVSTTSGTFNDENATTIEIEHNQGTENLVVQVYEQINGAKHPVLVDYFLGRAVKVGNTTTYEDTEDYITLQLAAGRNIDYHVVIIAAKGDSLTENS